MAIYFKSCEKCSGDMFVGGDAYGIYLDCIQCGFMPPQLVINRPDTKWRGTSIDAHIGTLLVLEGRGEISAFSSDGLVKDESLEKRLKAMAQYGYVVAASDGRTNAPKNEHYEITPKGREALGAYREFVRRISEHQKPTNAGISSYELVDEDGNLTLIGRYAIKSSEFLAEFIDSIYPMATISLESQETAQEEEHGGKQTVNTF